MDILRLYVEKVADPSLKGRERLSMREVAIARELEGFQILPKHSGGRLTTSLHPLQTLIYVVDVRGEGESEGGGSITLSIEYDQSMKNQAQTLKP